MRFLDDLYERELQDAARRLESRYGELTRLEAGREIRGRVEGIEHLPSGPHVLIVSPSQFSLVPAGSGLARSLNKTVALSVGRARSLNPAQPESLQLALRYRELALARGIGR